MTDQLSEIRGIDEINSLIENTTKEVKEINPINTEGITEVSEIANKGKNVSNEISFTNLSELGGCICSCKTSCTVGY